MAATEVCSVYVAKHLLWILNSFLQDSHNKWMCPKTGVIPCQETSICPSELSHRLHFSVKVKMTLIMAHHHFMLWNIYVDFCHYKCFTWKHLGMRSLFCAIYSNQLILSPFVPNLKIFPQHVLKYFIHENGNGMINPMALCFQQQMKNVGSKRIKNMTSLLMLSISNTQQCCYIIEF